MSQKIIAATPKATDITSCDFILKQLIKRSTYIRVYLIKGLKIEGRIMGFDRDTIFLINQFSPHIPQMIYKKAVSTILWEPVNVTGFK